MLQHKSAEAFQTLEPRLDLLYLKHYQKCQTAFKHELNANHSLAFVLFFRSPIVYFLFFCKKSKNNCNICSVYNMATIVQCVT